MASRLAKIGAGGSLQRVRSTDTIAIPNFIVSGLPQFSESNIYGLSSDGLAVIAIASYVGSAIEISSDSETETTMVVDDASSLSVGDYFLVIGDYNPGIYEIYSLDGDEITIHIEPYESLVRNVISDLTGTDSLIVPVQISILRVGTDGVWETATGANSSEISFTPIGSTSSHRALIDSTDSPYSVLSTDQYLIVDATGGDVTINLPAVSAVGSDARSLSIKRIDGSLNTVVLEANGSETIDGDTTYTFPGQYAAIKIIDSGTEWLIF